MADDARTSNWGRWGADDERGALNLVTPDRTMSGVRACRTGKAYSLAYPLQREGVPIVPYRGAPQRLSLMNQADPGQFDAWGGGPGMGANEDVLVMPSHSVTHMDALCHVYNEGMIYNGFPADSFRTYDGAGRCGIDKVGAVAARSVLLDLPGHLGVPWLEPGHTITGAELEACAQHQDVAIHPGDALLIRTGYMTYWFSQSGEPPAFAQPGVGLDAVDYIRDHDVAIVGADNSAVEVVPFDCHYMSGHLTLLVQLGIHLLEHVRLDELAADGVYEGLFVVGPLNVTGASGSPVNPVVIG
jgi:kynurenine formamidase